VGGGRRVVGADASQTVLRATVVRFGLPVCCALASARGHTVDFNQPMFSFKAPRCCVYSKDVGKLDAGRLSESYFSTINLTRAHSY
jgi:hypothetical protein